MARTKSYDVPVKHSIQETIDDCRYGEDYPECPIHRDRFFEDTDDCSPCPCKDHGNIHGECLLCEAEALEETLCEYRRRHSAAETEDGQRDAAVWLLEEIHGFNHYGDAEDDEEWDEDEEDEGWDGNGSPVEADECNLCDLPGCDGIHPG